MEVVGCELSSSEDDCDTSTSNSSLATPQAKKCNSSNPKQNSQKKDITVEDEKEYGISTAVKGVLSMLQANNMASTEVGNNSNTELPLEQRPLSELYELMLQHENHLQFLKENDMYDDADKVGIVGQVQPIFKVIANCKRPMCKELNMDVSL